MSNDQQQTPDEQALEMQKEMIETTGAVVSLLRARRTPAHIWMSAIVTLFYEAKLSFDPEAFDMCERATKEGAEDILKKRAAGQTGGLIIKPNGGPSGLVRN